MFWPALAVLAALLAQDEDRLAEHASAAAAAMRSGDYAAAEQHNRAIVRLRPQMAEADMNLGLSCFLQRKYPEAIRAFEQGLKLKPDMAPAELFSGISWFKLNQASAALPLLVRYTSIRPGDVEGQYYLGLTYLALEKYQDAETALLAGRKIDPRNIDVLYHLTQCYLNEARQDPSKQDALARRYHDTVEEIAAIDPDSWRLSQLRAGFYEADGKKADAIRELETILQRDPNARGLHYTLGCLYTEEREYKKALAQFQAEIRMDSPYPRTYLQLGHVYVALEMPTQALPVLNKALDADPASRGLVWLEIARAHRLDNQPGQAAAAYEKAIALGERKAAVYYQLAMVEKKAGNAERAREALRISQELRKSEQPAGSGMAP
jgi:tetratricopeptide (TPR) repeat protein